MTLDEIVQWFRLKQAALAGSSLALVEIRTRDEYLSAVAAEFSGRAVVGRMNAWVSGEFDFEALRVSDGQDVFCRHTKVSTFDKDLEEAYDAFIESLQRCEGDRI
jgi:hypothetical protein